MTSAFDPKRTSNGPACALGSSQPIACRRERRYNRVTKNELQSFGAGMPRHGVDKRDAEIGKLIKTQRLAQGMSQTDLGSRLDLTFQQIQKYENGINRVPAARLFRIAALLGVDMTYFFGKPGGKGSPNDATKEVAELLSTPGAMRLVRAYNKIKMRSVKTLVVNLVEGMVDSQK